MSLKESQYKFTEMLNNFIAWLIDQGYNVRYGDVWRSTDPLKCPDCGHMHSYQDLLVANGKSKLKASKHNDRLAADLLIEMNGKEPVDGAWLEIGAKWEELGGRWGGRFGVDPKDLSKIGWDRGHFEL